MPLKACVNHKDPELYFAHMQFFSEIDRCTCISIASLCNMSSSLTSPICWPCTLTLTPCALAEPLAHVGHVPAHLA
jgi:hypothetical protein